jgi:hypothetical protein
MERRLADRVPDGAAWPMHRVYLVVFNEAR